MTTEERLENYWHSIPIGQVNAYSYDELCTVWGMDKRSVRRVLHDLSFYDNGDNMILIRSSNGAGFYRTDNPEDIKAYRAECLNRGRRTLAPLRKIDRVLKPCDGQLNMVNNLKAVRLACGLSAVEVSKRMCDAGFNGFDVPTLSRMENNRCLPITAQLAQLAQIYGCAPCDLVDAELYRTAI